MAKKLKAAVKKVSVKKPVLKKEKVAKPKGDGKRQTIWLSTALRERALNKFPQQSFSTTVATALEKLLK